MGRSDYNHAVKFRETVCKPAASTANRVTEVGWDDRPNQPRAVKQTLKLNTPDRGRHHVIAALHM